MALGVGDSRAGAGICHRFVPTGAGLVQQLGQVGPRRGLCRPIHRIGLVTALASRGSRSLGRGDGSRGRSPPDADAWLFAKCVGLAGRFGRHWFWHVRHQALANQTPVQNKRLYFSKTST